MSGKVLRQAPSIGDSLDSIETDTVLLTDDTPRSLNVQEHNGGSLFDGTVVTASSSQRLSLPVSHPTDAQGRLQRIEFVVDSQTTNLEKHDIMLSNANTRLVKLQNALSATFHNTQNNADKITKIHQLLKTMVTEVKSHSGSITDIYNVQLANIVKELTEYIVITNTNREVMRTQYEEIMSNVNDLHSFMQDIQVASNEHFRTITEHSTNINKLNDTVNGIIRLIDNWTIVKRTLIKIGAIISLIVSVIITIYQSGMIPKLARFIVKMAE